MCLCSAQQNQPRPSKMGTEITSQSRNKLSQSNYSSNKNYCPFSSNYNLIYYLSFLQTAVHIKTFADNKSFSLKTLFYI